MLSTRQSRVSSSVLAGFMFATFGSGRTGAQMSGGADACARLANLSLPAVKIVEARVVAAGTFAGPPAPFSGRDMAAFYRLLPPFCRVSASAMPTSDSDIKIEVWMPMSGWNGKLQGLGNGGFAGLIDFPNLGTAMSKGYAATATDAGHAGSPTDATWALGHPEKVADFGHRGIHEMTRVAREAVRAFYGQQPRRAFFAGCSDGGREALMEAQRYPSDYDGILAGAPANAWTKLLTTAVWHTRALTFDDASFIPPDKIPAIAAAVKAQCDASDGVADDIFADPRRCRFDPATIECKAGQAASDCLTAPQVVALRKIYDGPRDASGRQVFPGYLPGAENGQGGWTTWITGTAPRKSLMTLFGTGYFANMVYGNAKWDDRQFVLDTDLRAALEKTAPVLDATDPNLDPFRARGGKLIMYHGWQDPAIPAVSTINYYDDVVARIGRQNADSFVRLYLAPGVQHCGGGPGPDAFGQMDDWSSEEASHSLRVALEQWVEKGSAPASVIASKYVGEGAARKTTLTRPLCPYPQEARYSGTGNTNDAASFACGQPVDSRERPDFDGIWNSATATPLERPRELREKAFFSPEEAAAWERRVAERNEEPSAEAVSKSRGTGTYNTFFREFGTRTVKTRRTSIVIDPPDGRIPPLTAAAARITRGRVERQKNPAGADDLGLQDRCLAFLTAGPPLLPYSYNSNYQIVETRDAVIIYAEMIHDVRIIHMDGRPHPPSTVRRWMGDSIGRWAGTTLVVDTTNFIEDRGFYGDAGGNFAWDGNLHLVERFSLLDSDTLLYQFDVDDPTAYASPWKGELTMTRSAGPIYEYACHEGNYSLVNMLRGLRAEGGE